MLFDCQNVTQTTYLWFLYFEKYRAKKKDGSDLEMYLSKKCNVTVFLRMEHHKKVKSINQSLSPFSHCASLFLSLMISLRVILPWSVPSIVCSSHSASRKIALHPATEWALCMCVCVWTCVQMPAGKRRYGCECLYLSLFMLCAFTCPYICVCACTCGCWSVLASWLPLTSAPFPQSAALPAHLPSLTWAIVQRKALWRAVPPPALAF